MSTCICGKPADTFGGQCDRCASLQMLGLGTNASPAEIESAYLTLVKVWHPDRFQSDQKLRRAAEDKLKEINAAHDYLNSAPIEATPRQVVQPPEADPVPEVEPEEQVNSPEPDDKTPAEVARVLRRLGKRSRSKVLFRVIVAAGGIVAVVLLWFAVDFFLSENAETARPWGELKAEISRDFHASGLRLWANAADDLHGSKNESAQPSSLPTAQSPAPAQPSITNVQPSVPARGATSARQTEHGAKPYLTSGLTPMEVLTILGTPTSSSGEKMFYQKSEIDFKNGHVAGWKIDPKAPVRVKLWADQPLAPGVSAFAVGSSKSDVIALQGTPTLFSDNEFGYGGSVVFFQNDHVVGWKEDPGSVRLRVAH